MEKTMIYYGIMIGAIFALSVESYEVFEEPEQSNTISCLYSTSFSADSKHNVIPLTGILREDQENHILKKVEFQLKDEEIKVNLQSNEGYLIHKNTPVWTVNRQNDKVQLSLHKKALEDVEIYIDEGIHSSFTSLTDKNGSNVHNGIYNNNTVIKPTSVNHVKRRHITNKRLNIPSVDHLVNRLTRSIRESDDVVLPTIPNSRKEFSKLHAPQTVYPEILVIMDHKLYSFYKGNMKEALSYIITFWNAVDLKFKDLQEPQVRLNIAGIIFEEESGVILNKSMIFEDGQFKGKVNTNFVLDDIGLALYDSNLTIQKDYDLAMYMMGNDLITPNEEDNSYKKHGINGMLGLARIGSACVSYSEDKIIDAVAVFEDSNGYSGVLHAIHELGHLFGALHDGDEAFDELGLPGATHCQPIKDDDYIMSTLRNDGKQFSYCSKESMRIFFHKKSAECLRNAPMNSDNILKSTRLPGEILSLDEQCQSAGFVRAYLNDRSTCDHLYCVTKESKNDGTHYTTYLPAAEGSFCGYDRHCINGKCVEITNREQSLMYNTEESNLKKNKD